MMTLNENMMNLGTINGPAAKAPERGQEFELSTQELDNVNGGLVVIAIIAILIGMLLPAVQKVR